MLTSAKIASILKNYSFFLIESISECKYAKFEVIYDNYKNSRADLAARYFKTPPCLWELQKSLPGIGLSAYKYDFSLKRDIFLSSIMCTPR